MVATILAGKRTELAYWQEGSPTKQLNVHQGLGVLVVGRPDNGTSNVFQLDPEITTEVSLPPGRFYAFEAAPWTPQPFVVSGLYDTANPVDWSAMELYVEPWQGAIEAPPEGIVRVPEEFRTYFEPTQ